MIKEYEDVKNSMYEIFSSKYPHCDVVINDMYTDEYNAIDINLIGIPTINTDFYLDINYQIRTRWNNIVMDIEKLSGIIPNQVSIIIYFKPVMEIRTHKISKIKSKISA